MVRTPVVVLLSLVSMQALRAQVSLVVPASHAPIEGTSSTNVPFGRSTPVRLQAAYDRLLFPAPVTITALALRADGGGLLAAKQVDCELRLSTLAVPLVALSADFAVNRGADETVVVSRQVLTLGATTTTAVPAPFAAPLQFTTPFPYDPAAGGLLIEFVVFGQPPGAYTVDATFVCDSPQVAVGPLGCPRVGGLPLRAESSTTQVLWGRPWVARLLDAPAGALVGLVIGGSDTGSWNGLPLPADLAAIGAPGCFVAIDIGGTFFQFAAPDGSAQFVFAIPNAPQAIGTWIHFQGAAIDPVANALGVVTSQGHKVQVCGFEPVGRVFASGLVATAGAREIGVAPVLQLTVQ